MIAVENATVKTYVNVRQFLPISQVSMLGECETKFVKAITGQLYPTKAMRTGTELHQKLTEGLPSVTREDIITVMKAGRQMKVREVFVTDIKLKLRGRIDQLDLIGKDVDGKNRAIIIDDKFSKRNYEDMLPQHKLQLAAYTSAVHNSVDFGSICRVVGIRLARRNSDNMQIDREFDVNAETLYSWEHNVVLASKVAWVLYKKERQPSHRMLDVVSGKWNTCTCNL